ncbi:LysR family transcriptional regulator [Paenibacillus endoradicis]|uniref:LysR family transcriptional regulator n=1 Tax=Paenibacillus endoradicis TaxID=2972487 RepID=UPI002158E408|nr:LysR family transcriptional regulator [Paenibacillus endoradicis]MCR8656416.1 LysR family transcriptional regulator [Paenibacillus endoradicis]
MINLEWYRIFMYTAQHKNLTKAAQKLHITQPSVSYAIKQLEESLEVQLFHRLSKGVELTEEGQALLRYVEHSFDMLDSGQKHLQNLKQLNVGEIRIGASDSLIKHLLLPQLNTFHSEHPAIRIRLSRGKTPEITKRVKEGEIDFALVHMPIEDADLNIQTLVELEDIFVVGKAYQQWSTRLITIQELAEIPLILLSPGSSTRIFIDQWFAAKGISVTPDIELGSIELLSEFARLGYGAAFISRSFVQDELQRGTLFELKIDSSLPSRSIGFAVREHTKLSIAAETFMQYLRPGNPTDKVRSSCD